MKIAKTGIYGRIRWTASKLYPLLHHLENKGLKAVQQLYKRQALAG